ncbi:MAG TPA: ABC transporter permease [Candidatus Solibacter sp.]|nr:ABC transporter permease [Candidatus Solibacter sp.]
MRFLRDRDRFESDLDDEMRFHLEMKAQKSGDRYAAQRQFGNIGALKEASRDMWGWASWERLCQDLRYAMRQLAAHPGFTAMAVLSLGLGIGANTAIFGLIDHVMLRMLPVRDPEHLQVVLRSVSYPRFEEFRRRNTVYCEVLGAHLISDLTVANRGIAVGELVTGNYFQMLGVRAAIGRTLLPEDDAAPESSPVAVISQAYWKRVFGGSPDVLGQKLQVKTATANAGTGGLDVYDAPGSRSLDGAVLTIVGVAPPEFFGDAVGKSVDIWIPTMMQPAVMPGRPFLKQRNAAWVRIMGRLKPGVTQQQASASLVVLYRQLMTEENGAQITEATRRRISEYVLKTEPGDKGFDEIRHDFSQPLLALMVVVALVLLIACLNVANLLLARATARKREIGVRLSLGAGRLRLVRQLLTESLVLAALGGALGIAIAYGGTQLLLWMLSDVGMHVSIPFQTDWRTLGFLAAVSLTTGVLFGLTPALRATRVSLADTLKDAGRGGSSRGGAPKVLVGAQMAVSMLLLIGAGLFLRTLYNLKTQAVGYNPDHLVMLRVDPVSAGYRGDAVGRVMVDLLHRVRQLPGVTQATFSENGLFSGTESGTRVNIEGFTPSSEKDREVRFDQIGPEYFTKVGIPILLGRDMSERDAPGAPQVCIINETMANFYFHGASPIGRHLTESKKSLEIVGVVRDAQDHDFRDEPVRRFYVSYLQPIDGITTANFEVRTNGSAGAFSGALRNAVQSVNRNLAVVSIKDVRELMDATVVAERLIATLSAFFGLLAVLLAAVGLYGVLSYAVARRTNEIGIRIALGAGSGNVAAMVLREVVVLMCVGGIVGLGAAFVLTRYVQGLLFGLKSSDPLTFAAAAALLCGVGLIAAYLPARRAARIDPVIALRYE